MDVLKKFLLEIFSCGLEEGVIPYRVWFVERGEGGRLIVSGVFCCLGTLADLEVLAGLGQLWRVRWLKFEQMLLFLSAEGLGVSSE